MSEELGGDTELQQEWKEQNLPQLPFLSRNKQSEKIVLFWMVYTVDLGLFAMACA